MNLPEHAHTGQIVFATHSTTLSFKLDKEAIFFVDVDILQGHKILFEDIKLQDQKQQIEFNGTPFVVLDSKNLDCTHGTDHAISRKLNLKGKKLEEKVATPILYVPGFLGNPQYGGTQLHFYYN